MDVWAALTPLSELLKRPEVRRGTWEKDMRVEGNKWGLGVDMILFPTCLNFS